MLKPPQASFFRELWWLFWCYFRDILGYGCYIGVIFGIYWGYIRIVESKMETTFWC